MGKKILIIEDDEAIIESLRILLESRGFEVFVCDDGERALGMAREVVPALVLLDLYLPGKDGIDIYKKLANPDYCEGRVPVIVLSSLTKQQIKLVVSKVSDVMTEAIVFSKPISPDALISKIEELTA